MVILLILRARYIYSFFCVRYGMSRASTLFVCLCVCVRERVCVCMCENAVRGREGDVYWCVCLI
jgi:hypothetical protein